MAEPSPVPHYQHTGLGVFQGLVPLSVPSRCPNQMSVLGEKGEVETADWPAGTHEAAAAGIVPSFPSSIPIPQRVLGQGWE
jgi:hypothetical protein